MPLTEGLEKIRSNKTSLCSKNHSKRASVESGDIIQSFKLNKEVISRVPRFSVTTYVPLEVPSLLQSSRKSVRSQSYGLCRQTEPQSCSRRTNQRRKTEKRPPVLH